ncbi:hypothetical protein CCP3SC1_610013 [Gammaproteobacteria bacterium]
MILEQTKNFITEIEYLEGERSILLNMSILDIIRNLTPLPKGEESRWVSNNVY